MRKNRFDILILLISVAPNYGETTGLLIEAIKEQQKIIQEQNKVIARQGQKLLFLLKEVSNLKQLIKK